MIKSTLSAIGTILCFAFFVYVVAVTAERLWDKQHQPVKTTQQHIQTPQPQQACIYTSDQGRQCGQDAVDWCQLVSQGGQGLNSNVQTFEVCKAAGVDIYQQP